MSGMQGRLVFELQILRRQSLREQLTHAFHAIAHLASFRYLDSIRLCTTMKASIMPMKPNSLKLTQVAVEKFQATKRLTTPITPKNIIHAKFSFSQTGE